jgi:hypothetical protein
MHYECYLVDTKNIVNEHGEVAFGTVGKVKRVKQYTHLFITSCLPMGFWWGFVLLTFVVFCVEIFALVVFVLWSVCPMLPISIECPLSIVPSVFSNVYIRLFVSSLFLSSLSRCLPLKMCVLLQHWAHRPQNEDN